MIQIAGKAVSLDEALEKLACYPRRTLREYDLLGVGDPVRVTALEIARTHLVSSRISNSQRDWFLDRAEDAPWVSADADLGDADPAEVGGLYDSMAALFEHFTSAAPTRVRDAKLSKVLHIKRPALYPILDRRIKAVYRCRAQAEAHRYAHRGFRRMFWAAIRSDLIGSRESGAIAELRSTIQQDADLRQFGKVTDLRLPDMLTWREWRSRASM